MNMRSFDTEIDLSKVTMPSFVISADSHVDEPAEAWASMPSKLRDKIPPGPALNKRPPGGRDPKLRIGDMEMDGLAAEVLYPTAALTFFSLEQDVQEAGLRIYNDWVAEYCKSSPDRLFGIAALAVYDSDTAIAEMHRAHDMGLRGGLIWQSPDPALPFTSDHYEKFWSAAEELGAPINLHILTGHNYSRHREKDFEHVRGSVNHKTHDMMNTLYDFIWSGIFDRHPKLKIVLVEGEIGWLPFTLQQWDYYFKRFSKPGPQHHEFAIKRLPSEIFRDHVYCTFMDDYVGSRLLSVWGQDNCMWSSDYPHGNTTWPQSREFIARQIGDLPEETQTRVLSSNVIDLYGLPF
jgi:predicted TIM-barrel fold metal-dependent hydrolase